MVSFQFFSFSVFQFFSFSVELTPKYRFWRAGLWQLRLLQLCNRPGSIVLPLSRSRFVKFLRRYQWYLGGTLRYSFLSLFGE